MAPINMAREWLGNLALHFGWALWGQDCDCRDNPFNGLAHRMDPWINAEHKVDDELEYHPEYRLERWVCSLGRCFVRWGTRWS